MSRSGRIKREQEYKIPINAVGGVNSAEGLDMLLTKMREDDDAFVKEKLLTCLERSDQNMRTRCVS